MVASVPGSGAQPFSVLYQPDGRESNAARARQQKESQDSFAPRKTAESPRSQSLQKTGDSSASSPGVSRYASYERDENGVVSASGAGQSRGSVLNITV